ncbi:Uncharacterised protein [Mycobacteroides abscessus subsp. abscessus]|nr:Uncharacterised protein [Mycobacteroides abscessus subsp. abscessus]
MASQKFRRIDGRDRVRPETPPETGEHHLSMAEQFKRDLGWYDRPVNNEPFHTTANRQCGTCYQIKPGAEFNGPVYPNRPDLNTCGRCSG